LAVAAGGSSIPAVTDLREDSFGLLIAYVLPGFLSVLQLAAFADLLEVWLASEINTAPTVAGFLYATTASVGAGLTASAVRWLVLDTVHHRTGVIPPKWLFRNLPSRVDAFQGVVQNHYRYYQFYGNTLIVIVAGALIGRGPSVLIGLHSLVGLPVDLALVALFTIASRDALSKYYARAGDLLRPEK
jgi:hypothetical protein